MRRLRPCALVLLATTLAITAALAKDDVNNQLVVHEWGTFTELHDDHGVSVGGINTDDEPVPAFVHRISNRVVQSTNEPSRPSEPRRGKSVLWNSNVTTRLETPVIYFYPPEGLTEPMKVDVDVQLHGGWLSEYYPNATASAPGLRQNALSQHAIGSLKWHDLQIGGEGTIPETDDHVWLAPRGPQSAKVVTSKGEAEEYIFYRGVGNFSGPLMVETDLERQQLRLTSRLHNIGAKHELTIPEAWLVHVRKNGDIAFRSTGAMSASNEKAEVLQEIDRQFGSSEYSSGNLDQLKAAMHLALVQDGLFPDEATAMLATWDRAYFQSPGLRLFYVVPQEWTDDRMPLTVSEPAQVERVMIGRIELVTDDHREQLATMSKQTPSTRDWIKRIPKSPARKQFLAGNNDVVEKLGVEVPVDYAAYLNLGRFRNALVHHELRKTMNPNLIGFVKTHGLLTSELRLELQRAKHKGKQVASATKD